jgi:hypothetical protein
VGFQLESTNLLLIHHERIVGTWVSGYHSHARVKSKWSQRIKLSSNGVQ